VNRTFTAGLVAIIAACCAAGADVAGAARPGEGVPQSTTPPVITGNPVEGQTLTERHAGWSNSPTSYTVQWVRCDGYGSACAAIPGATTQTYAVAAGDVGHTIRVEETAANAAGSSTGVANSLPTAIVFAPGQQDKPPSIAAAPTVSGAPYVGGKVQSSPGFWASRSRVSYAYQWQRCATSCRAIPGATQPWYTATRADQRARLRVEVTASNTFGRGRATSGLTTAVGPPNTAIHGPLLRGITPSGKGARLSAVRAHGYSFTFSAVVPGQLMVQWFYLPKGTHLGQVYGKVLPVLVATAHTWIERARRVTVRLRLTPAGGPLLASMSLVKLTASASFSPPKRPSVVAIARFALEG
jgi:hypothetical protein